MPSLSALPFVPLLRAVFYLILTLIPMAAVPLDAMGQETDDEKKSTLGPIRTTLKPAAGNRSFFRALFPYRHAKQGKVRRTQAKFNANHGLPWDQPKSADVPPDPLAGLDANQRKAYEIEALSREIKDKQHRVYLLMRLFTIDEKDYLMGNQKWRSDGGKERVQYEAAELLAKNRELAKLQLRLRDLQQE